MPETFSDASGNIYTTEPNRHDFLKKNGVFGQFALFAGVPDSPGLVNGPRLSAKFNRPGGLTLAGNGIFYIADRGNQVLRQLASGQVSTTLTVANASAAAGVTQFGVADVVATPTGLLYLSDQLNHVIWKYNLGNGTLTVFVGKPGQAGSQDGVGMAARFRGPTGLNFSSVGILNIADVGNNCVRQASPDGTVKTISKRTPTSVLVARPDATTAAGTEIPSASNPDGSRPVAKDLEKSVGSTGGDAAALDPALEVPTSPFSPLPDEV